MFEQLVVPNGLEELKSRDDFSAIIISPSASPLLHVSILPSKAGFDDLMIIIKVAYYLSGTSKTLKDEVLPVKGI
jgi:hypothetical protein